MASTTRVSFAAPAGAIKACEERRKRVKNLVAMLADPKNNTPVFEEAVTFDEMEPEHRKSLIHRWEARLEGNDELPVKGNWLSIALRSEYDFDRIAAYLYQEKRAPSEASAGLAAVWREYRNAANFKQRELHAAPLLASGAVRFAWTESHAR